MDINAIKPIDYTFDLLHPATDEPIGVRITLRSTHSDEVKRVDRATTDMVLRANRRGKDLKAKEVKEYRLLVLAAAVAGWKWTNEEMTLNGDKKPVFNDKNVRALLDIDWVATQIDEQLGDEKNFFKV